MKISLVMVVNLWIHRERLGWCL